MMYKRMQHLEGLAIAFIMMLLACGCGASRQTSGAPFDRHGMPTDVPLPNGLIFSAARSDLQLPLGNGVEVPEVESLWQVASPMTPLKVQQFYVDNLPGKGWTHITIGKSTLAGILISACQSAQIFYIQIGDRAYIRDPLGFRTKPLFAPPGGSAITIDVGTGTPATLALACAA